MYIYKTTKQYLDLAEAEIESFFNIQEMLDEHLFLCRQYDQKKVKRLAYTKNIYEVLQDSEHIDVLLSHPIKNKYRVDGVGVDTLEIADEIYERQKKEVSLEGYEHHYVVFFLGNRYYFCEEVYVNDDTGEGRRAHQREHNHPTSMHPLLAKAMINISGKESFLDPFCGSGGILIEGARMGMLVYGADISEEMIKRAEQNLTALGLVAQLSVQDALTIESNYDAIITDLPYGKNSIKTQEHLYTLFLDRAKHISSQMVIGCKQGSIQDFRGWEVKQRFLIYTHKSLTREILVLEH